MIFSPAPSAQRKNALKNKFSAVFNMTGENNYSEAIDKLTNDILEKLDADGQADWTKQRRSNKYWLKNLMHSSEF